MNDAMNLNPPHTLAAIARDTAALGFGMASEPLTGALLRTLAAGKPGGAFLELGTGTGLSTAWILDGMDGASTLDSVDNDAQAQDIALHHLAADPRLTLHRMDGAEFLRRAQAAQRSYDFVFADTWPGKYTELEIALRLVRPGGLYIVDDMLPQQNWPEGHAPKVAALIADLEQRSTFHIAKLNWASGIILAARIA
jgi:predicted O-methyltransferase YrrM